MCSILILWYRITFSVNEFADALNVATLVNGIVLGLLIAGAILYNALVLLPGLCVRLLGEVDKVGPRVLVASCRLNISVPLFFVA